MRVVAIADHDVFAGVRRGAAAASAAAMIFVPAAEITAFFHFGTSAAEQVHLLAYFAPDVLTGARARLEQTWLYQRGLCVQARWRDFVLAWLADLAPHEREAIDPEGALERLPSPEFPALQSCIDHILAKARPLFER